MDDSRVPSADDSAAVFDEEKLSWAQTRFLIRSDFARLADWYGGGSFTRRVYWFFLPNFQALFAYRLARYLFLKGWRHCARFLCLMSLYSTGVELSPTASIGPACLIVHAFGVIVFGRVGARCSFFGQGGTGGGLGEKMVDGRLSVYPVIGDDVVFGIKALALGPIRVGHRVNLGPAALVTCDVPDDGMVVTLPSKVVKVRMNAMPSPDPSGDRLT